MLRRTLAVFLGPILVALPVLAQEPESSTVSAVPSATISRPTEIRISDRIILVRDERMRQTHFTLVVHAGCLDEEPDCRGVAHYLEHLLLTGRNPDHTETAFRFFADGYANGWTTQKATAFVHRIAPRRTEGETGGQMPDLERLFAFYANRLRGFEVSAADALRERNVVLQEYHSRVGNTPFGRFRVRFEEVLLDGHPLGQPVIGAPKTIAALTLEEARQFHARWYAPNNTTVIVAGNLDSEAVRAMAARTFGATEPRLLPLRRGWEAPNIGPEHLNLVVKDAQVKRRSVRYAKLVRVDETESLRSARRLLAAFLTSQLAGSPHDTLVEQQGVTDGVAAGAVRHLPGLYRVWLSAEPNPDTNPEQLAEALRRYLNDLVARGGPDASILERLKRRFATDTVAASLSGERVMGRVIDWVANGEPYDSLAELPHRIAVTTPDDVVHLLTALAGPGRELTGFLLPEAGIERQLP